MRAFLVVQNSRPDPSASSYSRMYLRTCRASAWKIAPNCLRVCPKMTFRRRLGTKFSWYLQSHFECDRLLRFQTCFPSLWLINLPTTFF